MSFAGEAALATAAVRAIGHTDGLDVVTHAPELSSDCGHLALQL